MRAQTLVGAGLLAGVLTLVGCHSPVTEVVVVVDTDLSTPAEADTLQLDFTTGTATSRQVFGGPLGMADLPKFPATIGVVPSPGVLTPFSVTATLLLSNAESAEGQIVVARTAADVQFVQGQTRALVLTLLRACACKGTNCPNPTTTPSCADLVEPTLTPFDPRHIPSLDRTDAGASSDAAADAAADAAVHQDAARDHVVEAPEDASADSAVEAGEDAPRDAAHDRAADAEPADVAQEAAPTKFAVGHACNTASQCQNALCVDGVCCESKCACGTCSANGTCVPAAAGTDPRGACGAYTCDGTGACVTTCPQAYGECNSPCKDGAFCDGAGACQMAVGMPGNFCVIGTCTCPAGTSCHPPDAGGAGVCL